MFSVHLFLKQQLLLSWDLSITTTKVGKSNFFPFPKHSLCNPYTKITFPIITFTKAYNNIH